MDGLNIEIGPIVNEARCVDGPFTGLWIALRDGWRIRQIFPLHCVDAYSPTAINRINQPGAFVVVVDPKRVETIVADLRREHGPLPLHDRSGRFGYLALTEERG